MASIQVNRMTNANVYVDGGSQLGKAEEINWPEVTHMMSEHKAVGMIGKMELFTGIDKMEASIKWNAFYPDVMKQVANPRKALKMQCRSSLESHDSSGLVSEVAYVAYITGTAKNFPTGNFKQHDNVEMTTKFTVTALKIEVAGQPVFEFDAMANILMVDGVDIMATYRSNIGQ